MDRLRACLGSLVFLVVAPGTVTGVVPSWITHWHVAATNHPTLFRAGGIGLIATGLLPLLNSFARFAWEGLGTPAPVVPPQHLVVSGFYRYVRNPMYVALLAILIGESLLFWNAGVLVWAGLFWGASHLRGPL